MDWSELFFLEDGSTAGMIVRMALAISRSYEPPTAGAIGACPFNGFRARKMDLDWTIAPLVSTPQGLDNLSKKP